MDQEDDWAEEAVDKYMKRSGIRRIYSYRNLRERGCLKLEVVLRGHVFFYISLWSIKPMIKDL